MGFGASPKKPRAIGPDELFITAVFVGVSTEMSTRREIFRREMWEARRSCSRPVTAPAITERSCTAQPAAWRVALPSMSRGLRVARAPETSLHGVFLH